MASGERKKAIEEMRVILNHIDQIKVRSINLGLKFSTTDSAVSPAMELTLEMMEALETVLKQVFEEM